VRTAEISRPGRPTPLPYLRSSGPGRATAQGYAFRGMRLRLIRNATLHVRVAGRCLLIDPMLDPAGARPPVEDTANPVRNPLCELPEPPEIVAGGLHAVVVTHLHRDHLDDTAVALLDKNLPVFGQPEDAERLRNHGFADVRPVEDELEWEGISIARTAGRHGTGAIGEAMAPVSGFVITAGSEPVLYIAGDTIWCDEVAAVLDERRPDVVVVNAGAARFLEGDPIVMTADDVVTVARHAPAARVVAVHLEAINHCPLTRADLHQRLHDERLTDHVTVPEDGAEVPL
jgi:L-ascorbate metabolism protein UlaG (beta-lactamase superfamily)